MAIAPMLRQQDLQPFVELGGSRKRSQFVSLRLAGPLAHQALDELALNRAEDLRQVLDRTREVASAPLRHVSAESLYQKSLEGGEIARDLGRGALAVAEPAELPSAFPRVGGEARAGLGRRGAELLQYVVDERGGLGGQEPDLDLAHVGEGRALYETEEPGLCELLRAPRQILDDR